MSSYAGNILDVVRTRQEARKEAEMIGPSVVGGPTRTPGAKLWRGVIRNPRAVAWISDILDKAKSPPETRVAHIAICHGNLTSVVHGVLRCECCCRWHRAPPQLSSQLSGATKGHPTLLTSGGVADLSTVDPEVCASML